ARTYVTCGSSSACCPSSARHTSSSPPPEVSRQLRMSPSGSVVAPTIIRSACPHSPSPSPGSTRTQEVWRREALIAASSGARQRLQLGQSSLQSAAMSARTFSTRSSTHMPMTSRRPSACAASWPSPCGGKFSQPPPWPGVLSGGPPIVMGSSSSSSFLASPPSRQSVHSPPVSVVPPGVSGQAWTAAIRSTSPASAGHGFLQPGSSSPKVGLVMRQQSCGTPGLGTIAGRQHANGFPRAVVLRQHSAVSVSAGSDLLQSARATVLLRQSTDGHLSPVLRQFSGATPWSRQTSTAYSNAGSWRLISTASDGRQIAQLPPSFRAENQPQDLFHEEATTQGRSTTQ
ncbi:unnamed protein product, partial [Polarella glacialis]